MLIIDTHNDAILATMHPEKGLTDEENCVSVRKMREGGVAMMTFAAFSSPLEPYVSRWGNGNGNMWHLGARNLEGFHTLMDVHKDEMQQILCPEDLFAAQKAGKLGAMLSIEGGDLLEGDIHVMHLLHRLGVRMFGLCWSHKNEITCGCAEQGEKDTGLTEFGKEVVRYCDEKGLIVDLSHASDKAFWDVAELSKNGVCASHSDARGLCPDQVRNLTDEMLAELGRRNGYVGVNFCHDFLVGGGYPEDHLAALDDAVRHIEYMAEKAGVHCVGLGSDFDGIGRVPVGLEDCSKFGNIAEALLRRNWKEEYVRGVMGENFLRYWTGVWENRAK